MEYVNLGRCGLKVSRIALGCMSYGIEKREWRLDEAESRSFIAKALDLGVNFFDTANMYGDGASEEVLGRALVDLGKRDEIVIATKVFFPMRPDANGRGLSRKAIMNEIDASLRRLKTNYVDLYQIHRWDYETPLEETLEALHDVVKAGKARYLGASSMYAWQFCTALQVAERNGWTRFISMQNHYNLINREEEREMLPLCRAQGIGVIPWSPLARGKLARPWDSASSSGRDRTDETARVLYSGSESADQAVVSVLEEVANEHGVPMAQIALAWLLHQPGIAAPIVGATQVRHLSDAIAAFAVELTPAELKRLEAPYAPHRVVGFA